MDIPDMPAHAPAGQGSNSLLAGRYRLHDVIGRGATSPTQTIPEQPDHPLAALDSAVDTAVLPAAVLPATHPDRLPATRGRKGRHRKKTSVPGKFAAVVAVAAAAIIAPLVAAAVQGGSQQPAGTTTTTPTGIGSPSATRATSPTAPTTSVAPQPTAAVPEPTAVVPAPALTTPPVTDPAGQTAAGNGNGRDKPKNR